MTFDGILVVFITKIKSNFIL